MDNSHAFLEEFNLNQLADIYNDAEAAKRRISHLIDNFKNVFNSEPNYISRAPGRIAIIGAHVDWSGFPVISTALENDILVIVETVKRKENDTSKNVQILLHDEFSSKYKPAELNLTNFDPLDLLTQHCWVNYFIAGLNSLLRFVKVNKIDLEKQNVYSQLRILICCNFPTGSGISSSAAFTLSVGILFFKLYGCDKMVEKIKLALLVNNEEKKIGVNIGEQDHRISMCSDKEFLKYLEFEPKFSITNIDIPKNITYIVAHSLIEASKFDNACYRANKRKVEVKLALALLSKKLGEENSFEMLRHLKDKYNFSIEELRKFINETIKQDEYEKELLYKIFDEFQDKNYTVEHLLSNVRLSGEVMDKNVTFRLKQRLLHVCNEYERVLEFKQKLITQDYTPKELGELVNRSHESSKNNFDSSCNELNGLVDFARNNGAIGARLSGAGWGGCMIILIENHLREEFLKKLQCYYETVRKEDYFKLDEEDRKLVYFPTKSGKGACLLSLSYK